MNTAWGKMLIMFFCFISFRQLVVPDPTGTYCFSLPRGGTFETPGFETNSAYYYDYCPFGARKRREK